ncbi:unnamed protein product, partial [Discosporangium mesarthrocarpum]
MVEKGRDEGETGKPLSGYWGRNILSAVVGGVKVRVEEDGGKGGNVATAGLKKLRPLATLQSTEDMPDLDRLGGRRVSQSAALSEPRFSVAKPGKVGVDLQVPGELVGDKKTTAPNPVESRTKYQARPSGSSIRTNSTQLDGMSPAYPFPLGSGSSMDLSGRGLTGRDKGDNGESRSRWGNKPPTLDKEAFLEALGSEGESTTLPRTSSDRAEPLPGLVTPQRTPRLVVLPAVSLQQLRKKPRGGKDASAGSGGSSARRSQRTCDVGEGGNDGDDTGSLETRLPRKGLRATYSPMTPGKGVDVMSTPGRSGARSSSRGIRTARKAAKNTKVRGGGDASERGVSSSSQQEGMEVDAGLPLGEEGPATTCGDERTG